MIRKVIGLLLVVAIIFGIIYYAPIITSNSKNPLTTLHDYLFGRSYTKVNVVVGQGASYQQGDNTWYFLYGGGNQFAVYTVLTLGQMGYFNTTVGASYTWNGLEIKVSEVHQDYILLLVRTEY